MPIRRVVRVVSFAVAIFMLLVLLAGMPVNAEDTAIRPGFGGSSLPATDDGSTGLVPIGFEVNFLGDTHEYLYVNNNGSVTFDEPQWRYTPDSLVTTYRSIIAPFFADVDTRVGEVTRYGTGTVDEHPAFGVTWPGVRCYHAGLTEGAGLNYFQMILIDRSDTGLGNFDIEFNYDRIDWETGLGSGGNALCEGGSAARVGFSNGSIFSYELPGSGIPGSFLDTNPTTGLIHNSLDSETMGRYVWAIRGGFPAGAPVVDAGPDATISEGSMLAQSGSFVDPGSASWTATVDFGDGAGAQSLTLNGDKTFSLFHTYADDGVYTVTVTVRNAEGEAGTDTVQVTVNNVAPVVDAGEGVTISEGDTLASRGAFADPGSDTWTATVDYGDGSGSQVLTLASDKTFALSHVYVDNGVYTVTVVVTDDEGESGGDAVQVTVNNVAPTVTINAPALGTLYPLGSLGATVGLEALVADPGTADTLACRIDWNDGLTPTTGDSMGRCSESRTLSVAGVYTIQVTVSDDDGDSDTESVMVVVYDPSVGFVTGGGWIYSPAGAYAADPTLVAKASFGFVAKYQKGATVPVGRTEFQFHAGGLNFRSSSYEWLVLNKTDSNAQFKGSGTINGEGAYKFMLWAGDGTPDTFRIRIWSEDESGFETAVYDNGVLQAISGGSIIVHTDK